MALQRLDAACLSAILVQLRPRTRKALRASSRYLCRIISDSISSLWLRDEDWTEGQDVSLSKFAALRLLELSAGSCADAEDVVGFLCEQQAQHLAGLRALKLTGCSYSIQDLQQICSCLPGLTSLTAGITRGGGDGAEPEASLAASTSSSCSGGLLELDLTGSYQLSEADISHLLCLSTLSPSNTHTTGARSSSSDPNSGSAPLLPAPTISSQHTSSTPAGAATGNSSSSRRQRTQQLQRLCLKTCLAVGPKLGFLGAAPCLQHLDLHGCFKVNDTSLRALAAHCASSSSNLTSGSHISSSCVNSSDACKAGCNNQQAGNACSSRRSGVDSPGSDALVPAAVSAAAAGGGGGGAIGATEYMAGLSLDTQHQQQQEEVQRLLQGVGEPQQTPPPTITAGSAYSHPRQARHPPHSQQQQAAPPPLARMLGPAAAPAGCQLSFLNLSYTRVTDQGMAALSRLCGLRHLGLKGANVGDDGLLHLTCLTGLTALQVKHCHRITEEGIAWLAPLEHLQLLSFGYTSMPEADAVAALLASNHPRLTSLDLLSDQLSDTGLKSLGRLTGLSVLKLYQPGVSAAGMEQLVGAPAGGCLRELTLYGAGRIKELTPLGGLPHLTSLHLGDSRLGSPALRHLTALTRLQQLCLEGEQGLDVGLLQQLLAAGRLCLWEVRVRGCPRVSQDEVEEMVRGDPGAVTQVWYAPTVDPSTDDEEEGWTLCSGRDEEEY